jgi:hypothetical protein
MAAFRRLVFGAVLAASALGGVLVCDIGSAQAQGGSPFMPTGQPAPVGPVTVAQFSGQGVDPPYNPLTVGVPTTPDLTIFLGRADATSPVVGQFPMAFMTVQSAPAPSR